LDDRNEELLYNKIIIILHRPFTTINLQLGVCIVIDRVPSGVYAIWSP